MPPVQSERCCVAKQATAIDRELRIRLECTPASTLVAAPLLICTVVLEFGSLIALMTMGEPLIEHVPDLGHMELDNLGPEDPRDGWVEQLPSRAKDVQHTRQGTMRCDCKSFYT